MKFSLRKLFSVVDGRLSTSIEDVYEILNHITGENLMTHHLPVAMNYIKSKNLAWFKKIEAEIEDIKEKFYDDFPSMMDYIKDFHNPIYDIPALTDEQKAGFGEFMVDNSLLLKKANR